MPLRFQPARGSGVLLASSSRGPAGSAYEDAIRYGVAQTITTDQQEQAQDNLGVLFQQTGTGAVDRSIVDKARETIHVRDFATASNQLDGTADATSVLQAALNAANPGRTVRIDGVSLKVSNITIPKGVKLVGGVGGWLSGNTGAQEFNSMPKLLLSGAGSIPAIRGAGQAGAIRDITIVQSEVGTLPAADTSAYSGIAISDWGYPDFEISNVTIIGFDCAVYNWGLRPRLDRVRVDSTGITYGAIVNATGNTDLGIMTNCEGGPTGTHNPSLGVAGATSAMVSRPGTGYRALPWHRAFFTGSISGTTLTVDSVEQGTIAAGNRIFGKDALWGTTIVAQLTGTTGGAGTYSLSVWGASTSQTVASGQKFVCFLDNGGDGNWLDRVLFYGYDNAFDFKSSATVGLLHADRGALALQRRGWRETVGVRVNRACVLHAAHIFSGGFKTGYWTSGGPGSDFVGDLNTNITGLSWFTASISGNTMTVSAMEEGFLSVGDTIYAPSGVTSATITALGTGVGGAGTYTIDGSPQTVSSQQIFAKVASGGGDAILVGDAPTGDNGILNIGLANLANFGNYAARIATTSCVLKGGTVQLGGNTPGYWVKSDVAANYGPSSGNNPANNCYFDKLFASGKTLMSDVFDPSNFTFTYIETPTGVGIGRFPRSGYALDIVGYVIATQDIICGQTYNFAISNRARIGATANGKIKFTNENASAGVVFDLTSDGTVVLRTKTDGANANLIGLDLIASDALYIQTKGRIGASADGKFLTTNNAATSGVLIDLTSDGVFKLRNRGDSADADILVANADASTSFKVAGTKVVGARDTGWTAMTGSGSKGALAAAAAGTASGSYVQAEAQGALNRIAAIEARFRSLDAALITHGLIGS